jgi:hypothetical protein
MDSYRADVDSAKIGSVEAASTSTEAGVATPATSRGAGAAPAASRTGRSEDPGIDLIAAIPLNGESSPTVPLQYTNLLPVIADLLTGLAGSIALVGQASRDGVPAPELVDDVAATIGSTPSEIPAELVPFGEAAAFTAQQAGVAVPATIAGLEELSAGSQIGGWISGAVGRIEALAAADGSTSPNQASIYGPPPPLSTFVLGEGGEYVQAEGYPGGPGSSGPEPNAPPVPPMLMSLGKFFLRNIDVIYNNYIQYFDNASGSTASPPGGIAPDGLASVSDSTAAAVQGAQDTGWVGAGWMSYAMAGARGPSLSQGPASEGGEVRSPDSSPEEPAPPASITAGEIPIDILLNDPESSTRDVSIGLQQIAELIPIEESSLALVATLWTVRSDSRAERADGDDPPGERAEPDPSSASPPPWAAFIIGLDEAIERSRDACGTTLSDGGRAGEGDGARDAAGEPLEWRCPVIPSAEGTRRPGRAAESSPRVGAAAFDQEAPSSEAVPNRPLGSPASGDEQPVARPVPQHESPHDREGTQTQTEAAAPLVWAASGSALIAGWFWARRQLRRYWRLGGVGLKDQRRGGKDQIGEGSP